MKPQNALKLIVSLAALLVVAAIGGLATVSAIPTWYAGLEKPFFSPPNWLFGPVWTLLYVLMGVSVYLVWTSAVGEGVKRKAITAFAVQLALNLLWSLIFFGLQMPLLALVEIIILWLAIVWTIRLFYPISKLAAWLLAPYLAWVTFATILNLAIALLN